MTNKSVESNLKTAVERLTPDVLDTVLARCDERAGAIYVVQPKQRGRGWLRAAGALAAALVLAFGGLFTVNWIGDHRAETLVMLDVNPSLYMQINRDNRVLSAEARNEDAVQILDNMDLKNVPIDVAVNALIGSMLKYGYIRDNANSVLLSVEGEDSEKSAALQRTLTESISRQLKSVNGAVLSQNLAVDAAIQTLADEYQVSYGKAALVQKILAQNAHLVFADLAGLSVNELALLIGSKNIQADGMETQGSASDTAYIGEATAKQVALTHAGVGESEAERLHTELDYDDGAMIYEVEFRYDNREYEYEINASDGAIVKYGHETGENDDVRESESGVTPSQSGDDFIGEDRAVEIAVTHSGVTPDGRIKVELDKDDGLYVYEVEFKVGDIEYDYEVNAVTGGVVSWETEE
jgi:uncharacterized membrane protein YkoI